MNDNQAERACDAIAEMAAQRAAAVRDMTLEGAIALATWAKEHPADNTSQAGKALVLLLQALQRSGCYYKAALKGEEVFVLRQQDRAAVSPILMWAQLARANGCRMDKVDNAMETALRWGEQPEAATKWPD